ncbi:hypothetical protein OK016_03130 [Vibrio chagasii]|nr:hypothetical protein [Vibrio chagasii]
MGKVVIAIVEGRNKAQLLQAIDADSCCGIEELQWFARSESCFPVEQRNSVI